MARMTDEEDNALDERVTKYPPKPGPDGTGFFKRHNAARTNGRDRGEVTSAKKT